jgi:hypothetical protein
MIGDLDAARAEHAGAYAAGRDIKPGNAVLLVEGGETDTALAVLDRALARQSWFHLQRRGYLSSTRPGSPPSAAGRLRPLGHADRRFVEGHHRQRPTDAGTSARPGPYWQRHGALGRLLVAHQ